MPRRKSTAGRPVIRAEVEARLARRIRIWAEIWKLCPKKGCRRASRCLRFDRCAGSPKRPVTVTEAEEDAFRRALKAALGRNRDSARGGDGYDPEARPPSAPARS